MWQFAYSPCNLECSRFFFFVSVDLDDISLQRAAIVECSMFHTDFHNFSKKANSKSDKLKKFQLENQEKKNDK